MCLRPAQGHNMISSLGEKSSTKGKLRPHLPYTPEFPFFSVSLTSVSVCLAGLSQTLSLRKWRHHWAKTKRLWRDAEGGHTDMFFFVIRDKHRIKLPFIQILTCMLFCPGLTVGISGRYLMMYRSLRSLSPALTLWLLLGFASPPNIFCGIQQGEPIRWMKIGLMCLQKISKQH